MLCVEPSDSWLELMFSLFKTKGDAKAYTCSRKFETPIMTPLQNMHEIDCYGFIKIIREKAHIERTV